MSDILDKIVAVKHEEVTAGKARRSLARAAVVGPSPRRSTASVRVIATASSVLSMSGGIRNPASRW